MTKDTTKAAAVAADIILFDNWFDPIEVGVRTGVRGFIETMLEVELTAVLSRPRYVRRKTPEDAATAATLVGCRHGPRHVRQDRDRRATRPPQGRGWQDA